MAFLERIDATVNDIKLLLRNIIRKGDKATPVTVNGLNASGYVQVDIATASAGNVPITFASGHSGVTGLRLLQAGQWASSAGTDVTFSHSNSTDIIFVNARINNNLRRAIT